MRIISANLTILYAILTLHCLNFKLTDKIAHVLANSVVFTI